MQLEQLGNAGAAVFPSGNNVRAGFSCHSGGLQWDGKAHRDSLWGTWIRLPKNFDLV